LIFGNLSPGFFKCCRHRFADLVEAQKMACAADQHSVAIRNPPSSDTNKSLPHRDIRHRSARQAINFVALILDHPGNRCFERGIDCECFGIRGP
jgi:hypothetical protein